MDVEPVLAIGGEVAVLIEVEVGDPVTSLLVVVFVRAFEDHGCVVLKVCLALWKRETPRLRRCLNSQSGQ